MRFVDVGMIFILTLYTKNLINCFNFKKCRDDACLKSFSLCLKWFYRVPQMNDLQTIRRSFISVRLCEFDKRDKNRQLTYFIKSYCTLYLFIFCC